MIRSQDTTLLWKVVQDTFGHSRRGNKLSWSDLRRDQSRSNCSTYYMDKKATVALYHQRQLQSKDRYEFWWHEICEYQVQALLWSWKNSPYQIKPIQSICKQSYWNTLLFFKGNNLRSFENLRTFPNLLLEVWNDVCKVWINQIDLEEEKFKFWPTQDYCGQASRRHHVNSWKRNSLSSNQSIWLIWH